MRLANVSVDLDTLPHYFRIHGLTAPALDARARSLIHEVALPRLLALFAEVAAPPTLFAIGEELETDAGAAARVGAAHAAGAEIASHSHRHDYALSDATAGEIDKELAAAEAAIERAVGVKPVGFRAPGYAVSRAMYEVLSRRGYRYDSSVFPAAPYYAAKALAMGWGRLRGRRSGARLDRPSVLLAPRRPYRPDGSEPYRPGDGSLLELPIAVAPFTRLPFIGTLVTWAPWPLVRAVYATLRGSPLLVFELHAVDALGPEDGVPEPLPSLQRDLRVPWSVKRERLRRVLGWMARDFRLVTLADAAQQLSG